MPGRHEDTKKEFQVNNPKRAEVTGLKENAQGGGSDSVHNATNRRGKEHYKIRNRKR